MSHRKRKSKRVDDVVRSLTKVIYERKCTREKEIIASVEVSAVV
jgi:hypothetical protein